MPFCRKKIAEWSAITPFKICKCEVCWVSTKFQALLGTFTLVNYFPSQNFWKVCDSPALQKYDWISRKWHVMCHRSETIKFFECKNLVLLSFQHPGSSAMHAVTWEISKIRIMTRSLLRINLLLTKPCLDRLSLLPSNSAQGLELTVGAT